MLPTIALSIDNVSRLTGLSPSRLRRWDVTGFFAPSYALPDRRIPYSRIYSLEDIVFLRVIKRLLERGVPRDRLRQLAESRGDSRTPEEWIGRRLYVVPGDAFPTREEALAVVGSAGEIEVIDLTAIANDVLQDVERLSQRMPDQIGRVTRDRYIMNNEPIIAGTRIPIVTIVDYVRRGASPAEIVDWCPRLTEEGVAVAVAFGAQRRDRNGSLKRISA